MRKILFILVFAITFYLIEFVLFNTFGIWFKPNLLLLLVIFSNFAFGIRFSIIAAILAGMIKDSFSTGIFGINFLSFIICAYLVTFLMRFIHVRGRAAQRLLLVFYIVSANVFLQYCFYSIFIKTHPGIVFRSVLLPELLTTLIVANTTIRFLKICVSRLFVFL